MNCLNVSSWIAKFKLSIFDMDGLRCMTSVYILLLFNTSLSHQICNVPLQIINSVSHVVQCTEVKANKLQRYMEKLLINIIILVQGDVEAAWTMWKVNRMCLPKKVKSNYKAIKGWHPEPRFKLLGIDSKFSSMYMWLWSLWPNDEGNTSK